MKPRRFPDYLSIKELSVLIGKDVRYLKRLEKEGKILKPATIKRGRVEGIRMYSPAQVEEIKEYFNNVNYGKNSKKV